MLSQIPLAEDSKDPEFLHLKKRMSISNKDSKLSLIGEGRPSKLSNKNKVYADQAKNLMDRISSANFGKHIFEEAC